MPAVQAIVAAKTFIVIIIIIIIIIIIHLDVFLEKDAIFSRGSEKAEKVLIEAAEHRRRVGRGVGLGGIKTIRKRQRKLLSHEKMESTGRVSLLENSREKESEGQRP